MENIWPPFTKTAHMIAKNYHKVKVILLPMWVLCRKFKKGLIIVLHILVTLCRTYRWYQHQTKACCHTLLLHYRPGIDFNRPSATNYLGIRMKEPFVVITKKQHTVVVWPNIQPTIMHSFCIVSRGLISIVPRFPTTCLKQQLAMKQKSGLQVIKSSTKNY